MRNALVVGINYYQKFNSLFGCVNDALSMVKVLEENEDGSKNFEVFPLLSSTKDIVVSRAELEKKVNWIFSHNGNLLEIALFYFSGHGYIDKNSGAGYLVTTECSLGSAGLSMQYVLNCARRSLAMTKIIILDCCHSGNLGEIDLLGNNSLLSPGVTILTSSSADQYSKEERGGGVFTKLMVDALKGNAANILGAITIGSIYAHIDQSLSSLEQRPIFKANISLFTSLRKIIPPIALGELKEIVRLFPKLGEDFNLDPTYEPERPCKCSSFTELPDPIDEHVRKFKLLQKYNRLNLVIPVGAPHMYHAAMESKSCKLTVFGEHYWSLLKRGRI